MRAQCHIAPSFYTVPAAGAAFSEMFCYRLPNHSFSVYIIIIILLVDRIYRNPSIQPSIPIQASSCSAPVLVVVRGCIARGVEFLFSLTGLQCRAYHPRILFDICHHHHHRIKWGACDYHLQCVLTHFNFLLGYSLSEYIVIITSTPSHLIINIHLLKMVVGHYKSVKFVFHVHKNIPICQLNIPEYKRPPPLTFNPEDRWTDAPELIRG